MFTSDGFGGMALQLRWCLTGGSASLLKRPPRITTRPSEVESQRKWDEPANEHASKQLLLGTHQCFDQPPLGFCMVWSEKRDQCSRKFAASSDFDSFGAHVFVLETERPHFVKTASVVEILDKTRAFWWPHVLWSIFAPAMDCLLHFGSYVQKGISGKSAPLIKDFRRLAVELETPPAPAPGDLWEDHPLRLGRLRAAEEERSEPLGILLLLKRPVAFGDGKARTAFWSILKYFE